MIDEFKKFILKGNVVDLSTGIIIGSAFTGIVTAFTKGIVEPLLALAGGGPNPKLTIPLSHHLVEVVTKDAKGAELKQMVDKIIELDVGGIISAAINFLIVAAVVFFVIVKPVNALMSKMKRAEISAPPPAPPVEVALLTEIRDLLKK